MKEIGEFNTVWGDLPDSKNTELLFTCEIETKKESVAIELVAKDIYNLFVNEEFVSYGPARTAKGYCRVEQIDITSYIKEGGNTISVYVLSNNCKSLHLAEGDPFFGSRVWIDGEVVKETKDFRCYLNTDRIKKVERMSCQRGFLEVYDVRGNFPEIKKISVSCPQVLERRSLYSKNKVEKASYVLSGGVEIDPTNTWVDDFTKMLDTGKDLDAYSRKECDYVLSEDFVSFNYKKEVEAEGLQYDVYGFSRVFTGKFVIKVKVKEKTSIWVTFDDLLKDGYIRFNRERIIHGLKWTLEPGEYSLYSQEVYAAKYIQFIYNKQVEIQEVAIISIENPEVMEYEIPQMEYELRTIVKAAQNSFAQNAYDLFTDCPTRERSGWLCDSYFMAKAEHFFTGENKVEKDFLENYLLYTGDLFEHKGIMPMCYPAQVPKQGEYIPAWILWYVLELEDYKKRTGDEEFIKSHRQRFADILDFFRGYENEYELIEDLEGWVFVEWCKATDYVDGVNFPTNILYAETIRAVGEMLEDEKLLEKATRLKRTIRDMAFDGELYHDNAIRVNGKLELTQNVSEFNQIIAAYFKMEPDESVFYQNFKGRFRLVERELPPAALFIGAVLRLMTLYNMGEYELLLKECKAEFLEMAQTTGTLWELFGGNASCNHGFGAIVGQIICEAVSKTNEQEGETYENN